MGGQQIHIKKMKTSLLETGEVEYRAEDLLVNDLIGKLIEFRFLNQINCIVCGRKTNKSFAEGMCFPCFRDSPQNSPCILKPELCEGHLDNGRDVEWEKEHHVQPHIVYLALTDQTKVGITRKTQVPTRWIDQGAWKVIKLAEVPYRQLSGVIEVALKEKFTDKTNWRTMLQNQLNEEVDLVERKKYAASILPEELQQFVLEDDSVTTLHYPVIEYPTKITALSFDKHPEFEAVLKGIKGQYLIFDNGRVLNFRKHSGYQIELSY
jgi:hypothetical protein